MPDLNQADVNHQLLLACSRPVLDRAGETRIRELLAGDLDWKWLLAESEWHCVSSLFLTNMQAAAPDLIPQVALQCLRARHDENFRHNLFLSARMLQIVKQFESRGIPVIAYKGPVLCGYYSNLSLREFGDLDILVTPKHVGQIDEMLTADGFVPHLYLPCAQGPRTLPFARAFHYEMVYANFDASVKIDLHWALMPGFWRLPHHAKDFWDRLQVRSVAGGTVPTLSHEDTLLLLCAHGSKHMWRSLGWVCDVAALLHSVPNLDWSSVFQRAAQWRVKRALGLGLLLASDLLNAGIPMEATRFIQADPEIGKLAASVRRTLFVDRGTEESVLSGCWFLMRTRENVRDALRCSLDLIFKPTMAEWRSIALPRPLFPTYYFLRLFRLLTKHGLRN
jgi:putative nucleotidyltransferase-like protein